MTEETLKANTIETRCLRIVDQNGEPRAELECVDNGHTFLRFLDGDGGVRLALGTAASDQDKPGLVMFHEHGDNRLVIEIDRDGGAGIRLFDLHGICRAALLVLPDGMAHLSFVDARGKVLASLGVVGEGGYVHVSDSTGEREWTRSAASHQVGQSTD